MKKIDDSLWLIEKRRVSDLIKNDRNPRIINKETLKGVRESLKRNGYIDKIVINNQNKILSGHARQIILSEQDPEMEIDVIVAQRDLTHEEEDNVLLGMNTQGGKWNMDDLGIKFDPLTLEAFDISFNQIEPEKSVEEDTAPEVDDQNPPKSKLGDVWILGEHRVMCGDSTDSDTVRSLLGGGLADMVFTDPPYLMNYEGAIDGDGNCNKRHEVIKNDNLSEKEGDEFLDKINQMIKTYCKGAFYITFYRLGIDRYFQSMGRVGLKCRNLIPWQKDHLNLSNSDYKALYEPIFYGWVNDHNFYGSKGSVDMFKFMRAKNKSSVLETSKSIVFKVGESIFKLEKVKTSSRMPIDLEGEITFSFQDEGDIWFFERTKLNDLHPTMKPVALCAKGIKNSSLPKNIVLDLFGGSGSTLIACEQLDRKCCMMELDPKYVDVIVKRWQNLTGKTAYLESTNQPFGE